MDEKWVWEPFTDGKGLFTDFLLSGASRGLMFVVNQ